MVVRNGWGSALVDGLLAAELVVFWCTVPFLMGMMPVLMMYGMLVFKRNVPFIAQRSETFRQVPNFLHKTYTYPW